MKNTISILWLPIKKRIVELSAAMEKSLLYLAFFLQNLTLRQRAKGITAHGIACHARPGHLILS